MVILDFSKAFDKVPHKRLLGKLDHYGIRGSTLDWIKAFLSNRSQVVVVDGEKSESAPMISGVPQGTVLGPILFLIFINDLPKNIKANTRLFADDCVVYNTIKTTKDCQMLQWDLNTLADWEQRWGMEFHPQKCNVLTCSTSRNPINFNYKLKGQTLDRTDSSKYLGVDLRSDPGWKDHVTRVTKKANSMIGFLKRNLKTANKTTKANAYQALVRPHLEYCSSVWSPHKVGQKQKIEMVQRKAARYVCNDWTSSVTTMLQELGWECLESRRNKQRLTFIYKIVHGAVDIPPDRYLQPGSSKTRSNHKYKYAQIGVSCDIFKFSFFLAAIPAWNSLPATAAEAPSLASFKGEHHRITV